MAVVTEVKTKFYLPQGTPEGRPQSFMGDGTPAGNADLDDETFAPVGSEYTDLLTGDLFNKKGDGNWQQVSILL